MITILDYGLGNLGSIVNMLKKVGAESVISSDPAVVEQAEKLILPGVGAFDAGMKNLGDSGLIPLLNERVLEEKTPILGLCLGMQLLGKCSEEGQLPGLGWIDIEFRRFRFPADSNFKVPHMGWNTVRVVKPNPLIVENAGEQRFYFVHSYHGVCNSAQDVLATTDHGGEVTAAFSHENIYGVQFHPEKSHRFGMAVLRNFVELPC